MIQAIKNRTQKNILPLSTFKNPAALSAFIKSQSTPVTVANNNVATASRKNAHILSGNGCIDSSFDKLFGINYNAVYISAITHTKDDGVLLCGYIFNSTLQDANWQIKGLVMKADKNGNILWMKLFANQNNDKIYQITFGQIKELQNGDILVTGELPITDTINNNSYYLVPVFRLNSAGNQVWTTNFKSNLTHAEGVASVDFYNITEGTDGGIVLTGDSYDNVSDSLFETIVKIDAAGNKIWDVSFGGINTESYGTEGVNAYIENGTVVVAGISHGNIGNGVPCAITFITLDYATGNTLKKRFFVTNYSGIGSLLAKEFTSYTNHSTRLANGHYLFYGNLFSDFLQASTPIDHLAVVEFDESQNLINNAYTLSSSLSTNYYADYMCFNDSGKGLFTLFHINNPTGYGANVYIGSIEGQQIIKERAIAYNNIGLGGISGFDQRSLCFMDDGGYVSAQSYFINGLYADSYIELRRMHDSDTSSVCLGKDTSFVSRLPYNIVENPGYNNLDSPYTNYITTAQYPIVILDTLQSTTSNPCKQQSHCDTVKIHGQQVLCGSQGQVLFTAYKNAVCGSAVIWNIDTTAVDSISFVNDTGSVAITFKNINWQGELGASLSTPAPPAPVADSILLHIISVKDSVDLGLSTTLCTGNILTLHAGTGFSSFQWQDGSTDSVYTVAKPGIYSVAVTDFCGNSYKDTISITLANYYFSLGRDTSMCNDSLVLTATGGFSNYQWSPLYNISINNTDSIAAVFPHTDTSYIATAQKYPGCYVSDTIRISVNQATPVYLGNDTSFCAGDSIVLNAGNGFLSYLWNTGNINDSIAVKTAGSYSVIATNSNQCKSYDTLQVLQVFSNPVLNISYDSLLCTGSSETLNAGNSYSSYLWQDGSTGQSIAVLTQMVLNLQIIIIMQN